MNLDFLNDSNHLDRPSNLVRKFLRKIRALVALERPRRPKFRRISLGHLTHGGNDPWGLGPSGTVLRATSLLSSGGLGQAQVPTTR
jgi:hypothetical protein